MTYYCYEINREKESGIEFEADSDEEAITFAREKLRNEGTTNVILRIFELTETSMVEMHAEKLS